jgi:hypothetical protein
MPVHLAVVVVELLYLGLRTPFADAQVEELVLVEHNAAAEVVVGFQGGLGLEDVLLSSTRCPAI